MPSVCIFTPTYNRAELLRRLFESLCSQTCTDFEWLIVDDGSTDDTERVVSGFKEKASFPIRYVRQENGGKQRATNNALKICDCPIFFGVDSDDWLVPDAIGVVALAWAEIEANHSLAGLIALHGYSEDEPVGSWMPDNVDKANVWDLYNELGFKGDAPHIYKTEVMKQYPYPVVEGEHFISECISANEIAKTYSMKLVNRVLVLGGYQEGGLTAQSHRLILENPKGYCLVKKQSIEMSKHFMQKCYHTCLYLAAARVAKEDNAIKDAPNPFIAKICFIPSYFAEYLLKHS